MMKFVLIYEIDDYPECGGGIDFELFEEVEEMDAKVNELLQVCKDKLEIKFAGHINVIFNYEPKQLITIYERKTK